MTETLPEELHDEIDRIAAAGNTLIDQDKYSQAVDVFRQGLALLPPPRQRWQATLWFLCGIGDAQWYSDELDAARVSWKEALLFGGLGNPFVHLRRGQVAFDLGDREEAKQELFRAALIGGRENLFDDDDDEYWDFLTAELRPPGQHDKWEDWSGIDQDSEAYDWFMRGHEYDFYFEPSIPSFAEEPVDSDLKALQGVIAEADSLMANGQPAAADDKYGQAIRMLNDSPLLQEAFGFASLFWLWMSGMNASYEASPGHPSHYQRTFQIIGTIYNNFQGRNLWPVVGNPLFHLRSGQCKYQLVPEESRNDQGKGSPLDELSRALIGAGIEMFDNEDPCYLEAVTRVVTPPEGFASWEASRGRYGGSTRDHFYGASFHIGKKLESLGVVDSYAKLFSFGP